MNDLQYLPGIIKFLLTLLTLATAYGQADNNSTMCVLFPHSHLLCGQYIDASTMVYIDHNVFNYTEANNRITELDNKELFTTGRITSCRWMTIYTVCLSIYPRCSIITQSLVPPCMDDCLEYAARCGRYLLSFTSFVRNSNNPLDKTLNFIFNCSAPFRTFGSVSIDTKNCYDFNFSPIFVRSTDPIIESNNDNRLIVLSNQNLSEYCSELQSRNISVVCRAVGIPEPQVNILMNGTIVEPFNGTENEVVIRLVPISFGELVMFECQASTMTNTTSLAVNLSYTCCMDDRGTQHSIGEGFVTTDCRQCFCGNGGNIFCDQSQCTSNSSGISPNIIAVIIVITISVLIVIVVFILVWWFKKKRCRKTNTRGVSNPGNQTANHEIKIDNQTADHEVKIEEKDMYLTLMAALKDDTFKPSQEIINYTFRKHHLQDFVISNDCLKICELLGTGSFGQVFYGLFTSESDQCVMEVAIKTIKECHNMDDLESFITESVIMKNFKHRNILGLVGVSVGVENEIARPYIVLPFMVNKDLKKFLQLKRSQVGNDLEASLTVFKYSTLVKMCCDICCGMEYLVSIRKYVHRDLAARNCMVDKDLTIKIADFGLIRDIYSDDYYRMGHKSRVPIKWMPPESIHDRYYDHKTDVWSFGILCWEVFSLGKQPYPGVENQHILQHIESGHRLPKTALCTDEIYQIMLKCWELKNSDRPTFSALLSQLEQHYSDIMESDTSDPYLQLIN